MEGADECAVDSSGGEGCKEEDGGVASGRVVNRMPVDTAERCKRQYFRACTKGEREKAQRIGDDDGVATDLLRFSPWH